MSVSTSAFWYIVQYVVRILPVDIADNITY